PEVVAEADHGHGAGLYWRSGALGNVARGGPMDLGARIQRLEDIAAIERLKYRYWRCLDLKLWDGLAGCLTDHATAAYGEGRYRFAGAEAILRFLRESLGRGSGAGTAPH